MMNSNKWILKRSFIYNRKLALGYEPNNNKEWFLKINGLILYFDSFSEVLRKAGIKPSIFRNIDLVEKNIKIRIALGTKPFKKITKFIKYYKLQ